MTDEMTMKNQQPSALPYLAGGGIVGGLGGYYGLPKIDKVNKFMTGPARYGSFEEIIAEADDKFTKAVGEATGEEKTLMEKAAEARKAGADAGAKWEADLAEFQKAYKPGELAPLPEGHEALNAYNTRRGELIESEIEKLRKMSVAESIDNEMIDKYIKNATETRQLNFETKLKGFAKEQANLLERIEAAKSAGDRELVLTLQKEYTALEQRIETSIREEVASWYPKGTRATKKATERLTKNAVEYVGIAKEELILTQARVPEVVTKHKNIIEKVKTVSSEAYAGVIERNKGDLSKLEKMLRKTAETTTTNKKLFERVLADYKTALKSGGATEEQIRSYLWGLFENKKVTIPGGAPANLEAYINTLAENEQEIIKKLIKGDVNEEILNKTIKELETRSATLTAAADDVSSLSKELVKKYKGATIVNGQLIGADGKAIFVRGNGVPAVKPNIDVPAVNRGEYIQTLKANASNLDEAALRTQATEYIDSRASELLKEEQKAIQEARRAIGVNPTRTAEELAREFAEKNGAKEDVVKKAQESFKDDVKKLFEGKRGGKFWGVVVGTVAAGALIGLALKPSNKS